MKSIKTIEELTQELKEVNQSITDLNTFADMKSTPEERRLILNEWATLSQQRVALIKQIRGI